MADSTTPTPTHTLLRLSFFFFSWATESDPTVFPPLYQSLPIVRIQLKFLLPIHSQFHIRVTPFIQTIQNVQTFPRQTTPFSFPLFLVFWLHLCGYKYVYERVFSSCKLPVFFSPFSLSSFASFFFAVFLFYFDTHAIYHY